MMEPRHLARRRPNCWFAYVGDKPQYQDGSGQPSCPREKSPHRPPWHSHCEAESYAHGKNISRAFGLHCGRRQSTLPVPRDHLAALRRSIHEAWLTNSKWAKPSTERNLYSECLRDQEDVKDFSLPEVTGNQSPTRASSATDPKSPWKARRIGCTFVASGCRAKSLTCDRRVGA